ncbi:DUF5016 domain-containing protein [Dysgonomonas sp. 511]|uniref:DUF5016 domain-containing protein n=1 Tax=Dysgonomonas sp. 511 TaxID=2302930 RepID=UPI0013D38951|nr:DUF5016 domain-containing protein [Dysgonomonas sp. 511]NDV78596.1 DUF5016 domain-containing protein [Dysgonomonas sp. 511]
MNFIYKTIICGILATFLFASCEEKDERTVFSHSTPVIESAAINPSAFVYGDSITITAKVSDPATPLSTLEMKMIVNDVLVATQSIRTAGNSAEVSRKFKVANVAELPEDADVEILLTLINVEGDKTTGTITGVKGKRTYFDKLYAVLDDGQVFTLTSQGAKTDKYQSEDILLKSNSIRYKIAEKIAADNQIDYSGHVWGYAGGTIQLVDETGDYITTTNSSLKTIESIVFDTYLFNTTISGEAFDPNAITLNLDDFTDVTMDGETYKKITLPLTANKKLGLEGDLASLDVVFNPDYFDRTSANEVKFLGTDGDWVIHYNIVRKMVIINQPTPAFPDVLFAVGFGLGYPTKVTEDVINTAYPDKHRTTTNWERRANCLLDYILFRKISDNVYQGTFYMPGDHDDYASFKFFEGLNWENEKGANDYTFTGEAIISPGGGGNWDSAAGMEHTHYRMTIDLAAKTVHTEKFTLP